MTTRAVTPSVSAPQSGGAARNGRSPVRATRVTGRLSLVSKRRGAGQHVGGGAVGGVLKSSIAITG
jgi:hypothetical protein